MQKVPYASVSGSLMCVQVCIRPNLVLIVYMLGRYFNNPIWIIKKQQNGLRDIYRELSITCSHTENQIIWRVSLGILILILLDANTVKDPF